jgi:hypothetical protein
MQISFSKFFLITSQLGYNCREKQLKLDELKLDEVDSSKFFIILYNFNCNKIIKSIHMWDHCTNN